MKDTNDYEILVCTTEPVAGLQRIMALFSRNRLSLKKLVLKETAKKNRYEMRILIESNQENIQKIIKKMEKIIELLKVELKTVFI